MIIRKATHTDIPSLVILMNNFRKFYQQESNTEEVKSFLKERMDKGNSVIFVAILEDKLVGYTQLFPSFSTIKLEKIWILNDLFISEKFRGLGVASQLLTRVLKFSQETHRHQVWLLTGNDNKSAQHLYRKIGFTNTKFKHYVYNF
ncbi:GNAT family N-acetyltransferase [Zunongwangia sp.]|uniref:GNAT family N-acetyltransferase n=1 Tax=Zunongwangia sp. TaxID=1965325 RepID=UPI003AA889B8